ncbi:cytochrome b561 [Thalassophryne amazonica]|uniref:cytochrome b561 n=1 Tax=Thalassophryne amazonica TaxID=390379 RepID=UPI0014724EC3|nr:cytochrome b561 [Thalassophryne amazonica]
MESSGSRPSRSAFPWLVAGSQVFGLASVVFTGVWVGHYHGGFAWDGSAQEFNVHPLCMVLGLVFLQGDAILVYRVFSNEPKRNVKLLHGIIHLSALIISIIGLVAVFDFHRVAKIPDMYSLHSWCGMATFYLILLAVGVGFAVLPSSCCVDLVTSLVPPRPRVLWSGSAGHGCWNKPPWHHGETPLQHQVDILQVCPEGVLANVVGILLVCFGVTVGFLVTREEYRRPPNPEEESLSVHFKTLTEGGSPASP